MNLEISPINLEISPINLEIGGNNLEIGGNNLEMSAANLEITVGDFEMTAANLEMSARSHEKARPNLETKDEKFLFRTGFLALTRQGETIVLSERETKNVRGEGEKIYARKR